MYKNQLQQVCQQRQWALPQYTSSREGPDHDPRFRASVTVNDVSFDAADHSKSCKEAHNKAAKVALDHVAAPEAPLPHPPTGQISYKAQLQNYFQRKNRDTPNYECIRVGPPHSLRFKAIIKIDGQTFESPDFCNTLREAEHAAAEVALMALPPEENQQEVEEPGFYKNLLQELAQKEGLTLPVYNTVGVGASHKPSFSSTVEVECETFNGDVANTKKQAEMSAAKVAWCALNERRARRLTTVISSRFQVEKDVKPVSPQSADRIALQQPRAPSVRAYWAKKNEGEVIADKSSSISVDYELRSVNSKQIIPDGEGTCVSSEPIDEDNGYTNQSTTPLHNVVTDYGASSNSVPSDVEESDSELSETSCSILCNRVKVYPRKPDLVLPEGTTMLPFSDHKWVAVSLDFSNHEGGVSF